MDWQKKKEQEQDSLHGQKIQYVYILEKITQINSNLLVNY